MLSYGINYIRESFRYGNSLSFDILIVDPEEKLGWDILYSSISSVLGLSMAMSIWLKGIGKKGRTRLYARTNVVFYQWLILFVIGGLNSVGFTLILSFDSSSNYDLTDYIWALVIVAPLQIFLYNWVMAKHVYRTGIWTIWSLIGCLAMTAILLQTTTLDHEKLNKPYYSQFENEYQYIDDEIAKAESKYGIRFDGDAIVGLKAMRSQQGYSQVYFLKKAFETRKPVSLDTIILERIAIRNCKAETWKDYRIYDIYTGSRWQFVHPARIYWQIYLNKDDTARVSELFALFGEEIRLVNLAGNGKPINNESALSQLEKRRAIQFLPDYVINSTIINRDLLMEKPEYHKWTITLPTISPEVRAGLSPFNSEHIEWTKARVSEAENERSLRKE